MELVIIFHKKLNLAGYITAQLREELFEESTEVNRNCLSFMRSQQSEKYSETLGSVRGI